MTNETTTIATCGAPRNITGCARTIHHNGGHATADEITHHGNAHAADIAINGGTGTGTGWLTKLATATAIMTG